MVSLEVLGQKSPGAHIRKLFRLGLKPEGPQRATALNQPSLIVEPGTGRIPAVTPAERQRAEAHRDGPRS